MKFTSDEEIRIFKDGNSWCATRLSFINLQESLAGFGDNVIDAISKLFAEEMHTEIDRRKAVRNWYCNACRHPFSFKTGHDKAQCPKCKCGNQYTYEVNK